MMTSYGYSADDLLPFMTSEDKRKFSQLGGIFNKKPGQAKLISISPQEVEGEMIAHHGLKELVIYSSESFRIRSQTDLDFD